MDTVQSTQTPAIDTTGDVKPKPETGSGDIGKNDAVVDKNTAPLKSEPQKKEIGEEPKKEKDGKRRFVVDGEEIYLDEKQQESWIQKSMAAGKRLEESNQAIQRFDRLVSMLKTKEGALKILSHPDIGHDVRKLAEDVLSSHLEEQMLTPEQKREKELTAKLAEYESKEKIAKETALRDKFQRAYEGNVDKYQKELIKTLEESGLPKSNFVVKRLVETVLNARRLGHNITFKDVVPHIKDQMAQELKEHLSSYDGQTLKSILGDEISNKLREANLKALSNGDNSFKSGEVVEQKGFENKKKEKHTLSVSQFTRMLNK